MKYTFRGYTIFKYDSKKVRKKVVQTKDFNYCIMIDEDYKLLSQFFDTVYRHTQGEDVELKDINVN